MWSQLQFCVVPENNKLMVKFFKTEPYWVNKKMEKKGKKENREKYREKMEKKKRKSW